MARIHDSNEIPTATPMFPESGNTDTLLEYCPMPWRVRKHRWRPLTGSIDRKLRICQSARIHDSNDIPTATPVFPGSGNTGTSMHGHVVNQRWWPFTGNNNANNADA